MSLNGGREKKNLKQAVFASVILLMLIFGFLFDFSRLSDREAREMVAEHLEDVGIQSAEFFEKELYTDLEELKQVTSILGVWDDLAREDADILLEGLKKTCGFSRIRLVDNFGNTYTMEEHEPFQSGTAEYIDNILKGRSGITGQFTSGVTGEAVFAVYAPVIWHGRVRGGIAGILVVDDLVDVITTSGFHDKSYSYILDQNGKLVMQTNHPDSLYSGRDYFYFFRKQADYVSMSPDEIRAHMKAGDRFFIRCSQDDEGRLVFFAPTAINNWYVVSAVSAEVTAGYIASINKNAVRLTVKIAVIFLIFLFLILRWTKSAQKEILESKAELELSNKKFELAIRHTSNMLFDYHIEEDELVFITNSNLSYCSLPAVISHVSRNALTQGLVSPEYMGKLRSLFGRIKQGEESVAEELQGGAAFRQEMWFRLSMTALQNAKGEKLGAIGTIEDVTQERRNRRRYAQEEQYRAAILSEAMSVWSVDLVTQKILSYTVGEENRLDESSELMYSSALVHRMCENICTEDRDRIVAFLSVNHMLSAYYKGQRELEELFRMRPAKGEDYRWISCSINLLSEPVSGNPIAFAYAKDVDEEKRREMDLTFASERDSLTGLYNRRSMEHRAGELLKCGCTGLSALLMMDLDGFKGVNDKYGHKAGDEALEKTGRILEEVFGAEDIVARLGGDEFTVFAGNLADKKEACDLAEDVCRKVRGLSEEICGGGALLSVSVGIAYAPEHGKEFDVLYQKADKALYMAKKQGKNRVITYEE